MNIPIGSSNFAEMRRKGQYYVDKTGLIETLIGRPEVKVMLFTRPRRFGKTTALRMLEAFFDIRQSSRSLFDGLEVMRHTELCEQWMNQMPTICLSLRSVDGLNFRQAYEQFEWIAAQLCRDHGYLLEDAGTSTEDRRLLRRLLGRTASETEVAGCLGTMTRLLAAYYGRPVVILLDEYDVPLAKAADRDYYREMVSFIRLFMQVFKDNDDLEKAVITGCLRVAKESVFTGTNNFVTNTVLDSGYGEFFGFTREETERLLTEAGLAGCAEELAHWYDGYRFGDTDIYCPWDVMNYVRDHLRGYANQPKCYWNHSSDNAIVRSFVDELGTAVTKQFETLLAGGTITKRIREDMTYDYLHAGTTAELENHFWSVLVMTGYLTRADLEKPSPPSAQGQSLRKDSGPDEERAGRNEAVLREEAPAYGDSSEETALRIPNREVMIVFENTVSSWFADSMARQDRSALFEAVWSGNAELLTEELGRMLRQTISYHDYREDFYHAFLAGVFVGAGYQVESNREHGEGRSDVVVYDGRGDRAAVLEVKCTRSMPALRTECLRALEQIRVRQYGEDLKEDYRNVLCYGIAFCKKRCLVMLQE